MKYDKTMRAKRKREREGEEGREREKEGSASTHTRTSAQACIFRPTRNTNKAEERKNEKEEKNGASKPFLLLRPEFAPYVRIYIFEKSLVCSVIVISFAMSFLRLIYYDSTVFCTKIKKRLKN